MGDVTLQPLLLLVSIMWNLCDLIFFHVFPFTLLSISLGAPAPDPNQSPDAESIVALLKEHSLRSSMLQISPLVLHLGHKKR